MRVVMASGDLHCGHKTGLTPPDWQWREDTTNPDLKHIGDIQRALWDFWIVTSKYFKPDTLIINGDAIDGKGERSGGSELLTADRDEQTDMALDCIRATGASKVVIIYGTPYHTGQDEDWEAVLATKARKLLGDNNVKLGSHEAIMVDGVSFDLKHKIGSSSIPHGRATALEKERLWAEMWNEREMFPQCDIMLRSHVHYYKETSDFTRRNIVLPCLQWDTKYGKRQCSGTIDLGVVMFFCEEGQYTYKPIELKMNFVKQEAREI